MQPIVQLSSQPKQPLVSSPTQQPIQPIVQTYAPGLVQQPGPSSPRTLLQTAATTTATSVQPTTPISRVSVASISTISASVQTPQASLLQLGPTVQPLVQMLVGQAGPSTVVTSHPQFTYQPYQGQYQFGPTVQNLFYQYQPYLGYTYKQPQQPSLVQLILVSQEVIIFLMQIQFQVILDILLLGLVLLPKVFMTLTISYDLLQPWIYLIFHAL